MSKEAVNNPSQAYQRYGMALVRKAERVLRNHDDALDVVQNLFVELISKPPKTLDLPYLYRAVNNRCLNMIRNQDNRARLLDQETPELVPDMRNHLGRSVLSLDLVMRLVRELDSRSAEILIYHYLDDLNQDEVAEQLGISRRAVVKRLTKIRELARSMSRAASESGERRAP